MLDKTVVALIYNNTTMFKFSMSSVSSEMFKFRGEIENFGGAEFVSGLMNFNAGGSAESISGFLSVPRAIVDQGFGERRSASGSLFFQS